ncbi:pentapeptide repeat-containing protein [Rhizobium sp. LjRoot254]|uniref:pentapeptide repeat-containing protein n=1 Tax=Rhizobium sp. LjRoot254 TaxID=3342297 RepID=UPI003ECFD6D6
MKAFMKSTLSVSLVISGLLGFSWTNALADDCREAPTPGINWQECDKKLLMLGGSNLEGAKLVGTDFTTTDLGNANLLGANLEKAKLLRASLAGSTAKGARFVRAEAYRTDFTGIGADDANFESAELQRSNFKDAKLSNVNFTKAELGRSQFDGAEVGGSHFSLTNLARADFRGAHFSGPVDFDRAFFYLTRIEGVDFSAATGLSQWQLDMACGDDKTVLPSGLKKPDQWPCKFQQE